MGFVELLCDCYVDGETEELGLGHLFRPLLRGFGRDGGWAREEK